MTYLSSKLHDGQITVKTPHWQLELADTRSNRQVLMVILRAFRNPETGKPLFTFQNIADAFNYRDRRNVNNYWREFQNCGEDISNYIARKRKVDQKVVRAVQSVLEGNIQAKTSELCCKTNEKLGRSDLSPANIRTALDKIPCTVIRKELISGWESGVFHPKEKVILEEAMTALEQDSPKKKRRVLNLLSDLGMKPHQPDEKKEINRDAAEAAEKLLDINSSPADIPELLRLKVIAMTLYFWNVPLSRIGIWFGMSKSTMWRWVTVLSVALWDQVKEMVSIRVNASIIYIDEKWLKIKGKWHYWFVALDADVGVPVMDHLLPSQGKWACRWFLIKMKLEGINPARIITDGLAGYVSGISRVFADAKHLLCIFHHQQGISRWIKKHLKNFPENTLKIIKKRMKGIVQTEDTRTAVRRLENLEEDNTKEKWGLEPWLKTMHKNLSRLLPAMRKNQNPRTTNEIERFFKQFQRFYKTRNGFHSVASAKDQLAVFMVTYFFTCQAETGKAPIEKIMPEANRTPLYRILNDPIPWIPPDRIANMSKKEDEGIDVAGIADFGYEKAA